MQTKRIVIVGGNAAGMSAARKARRNDPDLEIIVLEKGNVVSYGACGLPYYISDTIKEKNDLIVVPVATFLEQGIDVRLRHTVQEIDVRKRAIFVRNEESAALQKIVYDRLILATGARPVMPEVKGADLNGVFTIRCLDSAEQLKEELRSRRHERAVIVGAGYIGLEMAEALSVYNVQVTVVEQKRQVLPYIDGDMAQLVAKELEKHGCQLRLQRQVKEIRGGSRVQSVLLDDGEELAATLVIWATGVRPNVELAAGTGIQLGRSGAFLVDSHMRTSQMHVYAAGDCAEVKNLVTNKYDYFPLGSTANKQGRIAGDNASGKRSQMKGVVGTAAVKVFDLEIGRTGITEAYARRLRLPVKSVRIDSVSRAGYFPGKMPIRVKLVFETLGGRLLGGQIVGGEGVAKRLDVLATALQMRMSVRELAELDLSYAPPFAPVWDPILTVANQAKKLIR